MGENSFDNSSVKDFVPLKDAVSEAVEQIENLTEEESSLTGISTGFIEFDRFTAGLKQSCLIIIAATPAMGKTTLALNIAGHIAINEKLPIAFFSMEIDRKEFAWRILSSRALIDKQKLRKGVLDKDEWHRLKGALNDINKSKLFVDDTPGQTVEEVLEKARGLHAQQGLQAIFVDNLQLLDSREEIEDRERELANITSSLKDLGQELNLPVVALFQLSNPDKNEAEQRPVLNDHTDLSVVEKDADLVAFIYRKDHNYPASLMRKDNTEIIIAKQRDGQVGTFELNFMKHLCRFEDSSEA